MNPKQHVEVEFTRSAWRQFARQHIHLGARFVLGVMLRYEVAAYIAAHEAQSIALDTICQEIHYDSGLYLLLMKCQGVWYITEVWTTSTPTGFVPVYLWQKVRCGWRDVLAQVFSGWRTVTAAPDRSAEVLL